MATQVLDLLKSAFRIAGVTDRPGRGPSPDQKAEAISLLNRMIGSWNCDELKIFGTQIQAFPLTSAKTYTIGVGGTFNTTRPQAITNANIIIPTSPVVRRPLKILNDDQWAAISVQDIPNTIPKKMWSDGSNPLTTIYLWGQPISGYQLELFTWQLIPSFVAETDTVQLPPGYELAMTYNLAILIASHFKNQQGVKITDDDRTIARDALMQIQSLNDPAPVMRCDEAFLGNHRGYGFNYLDGE